MSDKDIDLALVKRVQRGDKRAFDLLVRKYQHKIAHLVARYVRDTSEIQDVSQEAFIKPTRDWLTLEVRARFILGYIA